MRVLIVDDSTLVRQRLMALLNGLDGVEVVGEASGGDEALRLCQELRPDLLTLDLFMSEGSGVEFLEAVHGIEPSPRVVVLTNYPYPTVRKRCLELGAEAFLNKATEVERIREILAPQGGRPADPMQTGGGRHA
jgi:DNA-binding NarL/FixJ family response regulator